MSVNERLVLRKKIRAEACSRSMSRVCWLISDHRPVCRLTGVTLTKPVTGLQLFLDECPGNGGAIEYNEEAVELGCQEPKRARHAVQLRRAQSRGATDQDGEHRTRSVTIALERGRSRLG